MPLQPLNQDQSLGDLRRLAAEQPQSVEAHLRLGTALLKTSMLDEARAALDRALEIDPTCAGAWINIGGICLARWDFAGCIEANRKAAELQPDLVMAHYNQGIAHMYLKQPLEMLACFTRVVELDPRHAGGHYHLAVALQALGSKEEAQKSLATAMALGYSPVPELVRALEKEGGGIPAAVEIELTPKAESQR